VPRAAAIARLPKTLMSRFGLFSADMTERSEIELNHGPFAEPIGRRERRQNTKRAYAARAVCEVQEQQFEIDF
jgi:hypothetical protein